MVLSSLLWALALGLTFTVPVSARNHHRDDFILTQNYQPEAILDEFKFMTASAEDFVRLINRTDPTRGYVNYVDRDTAVAEGLAKVIPNGRRKQLYLGVDNKTTLTAANIGRRSIRLESKQTWSAGLLIADFSHMPGNQCGVWPAFWNYNMRENPISEIDILEGIGFQENNLFTLHTGNNCTFLAGNQTGTEHREHCGLSTWGPDSSMPTGCGITDASPHSYGDSFNAVEGGVYATLVDETSIKTWHWPRHLIPRDIHCGRPRPARWGKPLADMSTANGGCGVPENFHTMTIILNTDFCGSNIPQSAWDATPKCGSLAPTCDAFVAERPEAFDEAYWLVNSIKVYEPRKLAEGQTVLGGQQR